MAGRVKGQNLELILIVDNQPVANVITCKSFEVELKNELLDEGYLGETTQRYDSIFNGAEGKLDLHIENQDALKVAQAIIDKARQRTPGVTFNLKATMNMPNGQRPRMLFPDVEWGALPISFGGRAEYGSLTLNFGVSSPELITT